MYQVVKVAAEIAKFRQTKAKKKNKCSIAKKKLNNGMNNINVKQSQKQCNRYHPTTLDEKKNL